MAGPGDPAADDSEGTLEQVAGAATTLALSFLLAPSS